MAEVEQKDLWRKYDFKTEPIPRLKFDSFEADRRIGKGLPCILEGSNLSGPALNWTNDYLEQHIGDGKCTVFVSKTHKFKYFDDKKIPGHEHFKVPMKRREMTFADFYKRLKSSDKSRDRFYLQQSLNEGVGKKIVSDFLLFNWGFINTQARKNNWGQLTSNLLLIGQEGNVTPCHYDEQENFYSQLIGQKRVILFPPSNYECLYPYPVHHPHDRQVQVDFENPNYELFPKFRNVTPLETVLKPGDVLYLPMYWFHHFESWLHGGPTTSLTFWYKAAPTGQIAYPLADHQKVAMTRNLEKIVSEALNNIAEVGPFFRNLVLGRYTHDPDRPPAPSSQAQGMETAGKEQDKKTSQSKYGEDKTSEKNGDVREKAEENGCDQSAES